MSVIFLCKYFTKESFYGDIGSFFVFDSKVVLFIWYAEILLGEKMPEKK